ncbi:hypothetical protein ABZX65_27045 [Streptomyces sp. NPDC003300]|uniref:hypothetical protein n=1 Tax=unclassified Streptomyces TaxID=2593676 RepID=UPI0033A9A54A
MATVECAIARINYDAGKTGIEIAQQWIVAHLEAFIAVRDERAKNPMNFPGFGDGTPEETARRVVARLLDAGWRPPDTECLDLPAIPEELS